MTRQRESRPTGGQLPAERPALEMNTLSLPDAALAYATAQFEVFPLKPRTKEPATRNGFHAATSELATVRRWWTKCPDANIGLRPPPGVIVLDVDPRNGGDETLVVLIAECGPLPTCPTVQTPSGGQHFYLRHDGPALRLGKGIDVKTHDSGYVVVPPSVLDPESGRCYRW